jgi:hypothetical protein
MDPTSQNRQPWEDDTQPVPPPADPAVVPPSAAWDAPPAVPPPPAWSPQPTGGPPAETPSPAGAPPRPAPPPSSSNTQGTLVLGILLVLVGGGFLVTRVVDLQVGEEAWPLWIIAVGAAMLLASLAVRSSGGLGLAIPGGIVTMVGIVLAVQAAYDAYQTWAYAWALVAPGGVGLGMLIHGLFTGDRESRDNGFQTILVGLGLFAGFALFFEGVIGLSGARIPGLDDALPVIVIVLGIVLVVASLFGPRRKRA